MESDRQIIGSLSRQNHYLHAMTEEESRRHKEVLLSIYKDVAALCQKHELMVMLCGGSALGAVRHKGFIPWDDDIDILMLRKDYEKLLQLIKEGQLGDKYEYSAPDKHNDSKSVWLKIYRKDTLCLDIYASANAPYPKGVYIDVFPLDSVPKSRLGQWTKGLIAKGLEFCSILVMYSQYPNQQLGLMMKSRPGTHLRYVMKRALGMILRIIPHRKWVWWFDQWVKDETEDAPLGIPTGRMYYNGEIFDREVYLEPSDAEFEGLKVKIPHLYDIYLRNLYHDYMQLPPVEKREKHFILEFKA